jgi:hypothetical protein
MRGNWQGGRIDKRKVGKINIAVEMVSSTTSLTLVVKSFLKIHIAKINLNDNAVDL